MTALLVGLGTLAIVSFAVSALVSMTWCLLSRILRRVTPAAEARLLLLIVLSPIAVASLSQFLYWEELSGGEHPERTKGWNRPVIRSDTSYSAVWAMKNSIPVQNKTFNAWEIEGREVDHEGEEHDEHHRQPSMQAIKPGYSDARKVNFSSMMLLIFILSGSALIGRFLLMLMRTLQAIKTSTVTARLLRDLALTHPNGLLVLPTAKPEAFVVGMMRPNLFASQGLFKMPETIVQAVLAHERAHIRRLDPLRHLLVLMACTFHLPGIAAHLQKRMQQVQELAADADAADTLGDVTYVAEAIVICARFHHDHNAPQLAFGGGDLEERVHTLLDGCRTLDQPRPWLVGLLTCMVVYAAVRYAEPAHHIIAHHLIKALLAFSP